MALILALDIGVRNLGFCRLRVAPTSVTLLDVGTLVLVDESDNVTRMPVEAIVYRICTGFDSLVSRFVPESLVRPVYPTKIVIEEQPTRIGRRLGNIKMKIVSHVLQALLTRQFPLSEVVFVPASVKFTEMPSTVDRSDYRARKRFGVTMAQDLVRSSRVLDPSGILATRVATHAKLDDLSDALLLGFYGANATQAPPRAPRPRRRRAKRQRLQPIEAPEFGSDASDRS